MREISDLPTSLAKLPLRLDHVRVVSTRVEVTGYPDGPRPTSTVELLGAGRSGYGEHVGWTDEEHRNFRIAADALSPNVHTVGEWSSSLQSLPAYDRAALEAAAIDLALRQHDTNLYRFAGVAPRPVRYVVSFARTDDPLAEMGTLAPGDIEWKIDADPDWSNGTWQRLSARGRVAVIDFKMTGDTDAHERACRHLPEAWIEDPLPGPLPWSPALAARRSSDASILAAADIDKLSPLPAAINVKPARMGGVLEAMNGLVRANHKGLVTYIGGMFEVGVGRRQLLALAAIFCADGPNDIAPLLHTGPRPSRLHADGNATGFAGQVVS